jgi:hypothetical protein
MAKKASHDAAKLNEVLKLQKRISSIIAKHDKLEDIVEDENIEEFHKIYFYLIRIIKIASTFSTKLKKEQLAFQNKFRNNIVLENLSECYPVISNIEILKYANDVTQGYTMDRVKEFYTMKAE